MTAAAGGRLAGRVAVVTGASRGIGAAVARRFAAEGAHVVLVARTVGALEEVDDAIRAAGGRATIVPLDVTEGARVDALGPALLERHGGVDILVSAAAVLGTLTPLGHLRPQDWDRVLATNLTAAWRLIRTLDPLLRRADAGRAVFLTAAEGREATPYWGPYAVAKSGLETLVRVYAGELGRTRVRANLFDPGPVATALRTAAFPGEDASRLPAPDDVTDAILRLVLPDCVDQGRLATREG